jgi:hypothetical protein
MFNQNLGKVPIMNTNTISKQVTQDITNKAAKAEGKTNGRPSEDMVLELDDALSMVSGMDFFGKSTKPFHNKNNDNDERNGSFCTMPVKMKFSSKDARTRAEKLLKKKCKIACTVPYPQRLRLAIKDTLQKNKEKFPKCFIQVKVDPENLSLVLSRRDDKGWTNNYDTVKLETSVMDLGTVRNSDMDVDSSQQAL